MHRNRHWVNYLRPLDRPEHGDERIRTKAVVGVVFVSNPVEVKLDRRRIDRAAVVEGNSVTQLEGVGFAVRTDEPGGCQRRLNLKSALAESHKRLIDVGQDTKIAAAIAGRWVERREFREMTEDECVARRSRLRSPSNEYAE